MAICPAKPKPPDDGFAVRQQRTKVRKKAFASVAIAKTQISGIESGIYGARLCVQALQSRQEEEEYKKGWFHFYKF
jgi:hypothetical protein